MGRSPRPTGLAKTSPPRTARVHARRRLFKRLDAATRKPVTWIAGPAGAGKTTLVASYLADRKRPCVWYQLDASDRDPAQLFEYFPRALAAAFPRRKPPRLPRFGPESLGGLGAFTRRYFEAVYATLPERAVVVFDNYHEVVADAGWHEVFREALAAVPRGLTVVVTSRAEPPPALARMSANGTLERLGWDELRLTGDETRGIARAHAHQLRAAQSEQVHELAGGWVAGLILLLEQPSLPDVTRRDPASQALFDYFAAEILDRLEPDTRELLLHTAIVSSVEGELAQRLCPRLDATRILSKLRRESLFTEYRGDDTYQYHPLFRTFLIEQCHQVLGTDEVAALRVIAAGFLAEHGRADEAISLLSDPRARADLVLREAPTRMMQGRGLTVAGWIEALPADLIEERPWLLYWKGVCCLGFAPIESLERLTKAFERFREPVDVPGLHLAWAAAVQAIVHAGHAFSQLEGWIVRFAELPPCPVPPIEARTATGMLMALTFWKPGSEQARVWAERAMMLAERAGDAAHRLVTGGMAVVYHSFFGEHVRATSIIDLLRDLATDDAEGLALVTLLQAESLHAWIAGHDETCLLATDRGLDAASRTGVVVWNDQLAAFGASAAFSIDDARRARPYLDIMAASAGVRPTFASGNYHYHSGMEAFARGDLLRAEHDLTVSLDIADQIGYPFARSVSRVTLAQVLAAASRRDAAHVRLAEGVRIAEAAGAALLSYGAGLVEAELALDEGRGADARDAIRSAFRLARERGYFNFWVSREATTRLALLALENGIEVDHVKELVRRRHLAPASPPLHVEQWPWRLRIRVLGGLEVEGTKAIKGAPRRLLEAIVALGRGSASHEYIATRLWPDAEGDATRGVFDTTLYRLRKLLPENVLELDGGRVALDPFAVWLDVHAFEHATDEIVRTVEHDDDAAERAGATMFQLYRGQLFGDDDEPWMTGPRERLHDRFLHSVERLGERALQREDAEAARAVFARGLDVDATAERLHRGLIAALVRLDRRGEAWVAFERCRRELKDHLGIEPAPATRGLVAP